MNLKINIEKNQFNECFNDEEILETKVRFSAAHILKKLEMDIKEEYDNEAKISLAHLVDYDTTGNGHCIFGLVSYEEVDDELVVTYEYETTVS